MDKPLTIRRIRIAVSVFFAVLTVALGVLWVVGYVDDARSYFGFDWRNKFYSINWSHGHFGVVSVLSKHHGQGNNMVFFGGRHQSMAGVLGFRFLVFDNGWSFFMPSWISVLVCSACSIALWKPWPTHFSLRALLIATTLVAVVLGLGAWLIG